VAHLASSIAAGDGHTLFTTESGDVYASGRGRQGQLGLATRENQHTPTLVAALSHESVVRVAASGVSSYAITATGRVYHWGLVHRPNHAAVSYAEEAKGDDKETSTKVSPAAMEAYEQVTAGQLTGLAENQEDIIVHVDVEARTHIQNQDEPQYASRQLKDIVTNSTERWMLANDDADSEYYRELQSMGYEKEELDERMQNRGKEYHGMLRIQCKRIILPSPELISSLSHVKIVSLAAGFAHCIALTDQGVMYSCGYNDRGQLGLGHRISSSEFKVVDYMQGKTVLQVECGQQHSMCRAIDRVSMHSKVSAAPVDFSASTHMGASVFVWGNGMLGQLGLGLKGTSKGRLLPTLLTTLCDVAPLGAVDISAGGNFSVAVAVDGTVFSWGHAEYNQHGSTMVGGNDYVDNHFYFVPRPIAITGRNGMPEKITQVSCGSNFTVAMTDEGDAYSWGWNAYGVLGHGRGYFGQSALKIASLGQSQIDRSVVHVCTGSNHVLAITASSGNAWAKTFQQHLHPCSVLCAPFQPSPYDCETFSDMEILDEASGQVFPCHQVILAARSPYFAGFLRTAVRMKTLSREEHRGGGSVQDFPKEQIVLECPAATVSTIQYLLQYIYTDTLSAPAHKRKALAELAEFVGMHRLVSLCRHHGAYTDRVREDTAPPISPSTFENDMLAMVKNDLFSDCKFLVHAMPEESEGHKQQEPVLMSGHKLLLAKMPYFSSLFSGDFNDGHVDADGVVVYDLAGFLSDGINMDAVERLIKYAYSGAASVLDVQDSRDLMSLLIASNRVGLFQLTQLCEKKLSLHLNDYPENIENCYAFAQVYNITRLTRQCEELLNLSLTL
jgi:alpha-tubulin suppressor-like RCC1 family protein